MLRTTCAVRRLVPLLARAQTYLVPLILLNNLNSINIGVAEQNVVGALPDLYTYARRLGMLVSPSIAAQHALLRRGATF
jgi:hypothetical protein